MQFSFVTLLAVATCTIKAVVIETIDITVTETDIVTSCEERIRETYCPVPPEPNYNNVTNGTDNIYTIYEDLAANRKYAVGAVVLAAILL